MAYTRILIAATLPLLSLPAAPAAAQGECTGTPSTTRLYVDVENVRASTGLIAVTLYADDRKKFLAKRGSLYVGRVPARSPSTRVCIHLPRPGVYGLAVYHDADGDRGFDKNGIGLPAEAFGFSRNPKTLFGLPSWDSVRMHVPRTNMRTTVRLKYP